MELEYEMELVDGSGIGFEHQNDVMDPSVTCYFSPEHHAYDCVKFSVHHMTFVILYMINFLIVIFK